MADPDQTAGEGPWHAKFPSPRTTEPNAITREDLLKRFEAGQRGGQDFLLVDLRRTDHEGGTINHSINLPAQTLYHSLPSIYNILVSGKIPLAIFYCGSSSGRGTRAAGWLADHIDAQQTSNPQPVDEGFKPESVILKGGIKGWALAGDDYTKWMTAYDEKHWKQFAEVT